MTVAITVEVPERTPPNAKAADWLCPAPAKLIGLETIVPPEAHAPVPCAPYPFKVALPVLYQSCPETGLDGSLARLGISIPLIPI